MKREELEDYLSEHDFRKDTFGHFHRNGFRVKMQARSIRIERGVDIPATKYTKSRKLWIMRYHAYLSELSIDSEGKLVGLRRKNDEPAVSPVY